MPPLDRIQVFDPAQPHAVVHRRLPHWSQAGTLSFITWRTQDSIPADVLRSWINERDAWLRAHDVDPAGDWREQLRQLEARQILEFQQRVSDRWNDDLDACYGACELRRPEVSSIVADSLLHFDGDRYDATDFVVMPNHVHVLAAFPDEAAMLAQCDSWKKFTAAKINRLLDRQGRFWQRDGFDHLVRSVQQFTRLRCYVAENPRRAKLSEGEYRHYSKPM